MRRPRVWRLSVQCYNTLNVCLRFKSGYVGISGWAAFSTLGDTPLVLIDGALNWEKYQAILEAMLHHFSCSIMDVQKTWCINKTTLDRIMLSFIATFMEESVWMPWNGRLRALIWVQSRMHGLFSKEAMCTSYIHYEPNRSVQRIADGVNVYSRWVICKTSALYVYPVLPSVAEYR